MNQYTIKPDTYLIYTRYLFNMYLVPTGYTSSTYWAPVRYLVGMYLVLRQLLNTKYITDGQQDAYLLLNMICTGYLTEYQIMNMVPNWICAVYLIGCT